MKLTRVTITGADDSFDPKHIVTLSRRYPFVEWGILFSEKHQGTPRYPSLQWVGQLEDILRPVPADERPNLSAHLCGRLMRRALVGMDDWWRGGPGMWSELFQRVQLNFHAENIEADYRAMRALPHAGRFIFQCDGENDAAVRALTVDHKLGFALFDRSSGGGVTPETWPAPFTTEGLTHYGYAGGIGPDNLLAEVRRIQGTSDADGLTFWIDMERNVRSTDDAAVSLDIRKVRRVLDDAKMLVGR